MIRKCDCASCLGNTTYTTVCLRRSLARTILQEDVAEFMHLVHEEGVCVSDPDAHNWSALHWACSRGSTVMTYVILQEMRAPQEAGDSTTISRDPFSICSVMSAPDAIFSPMNVTVNASSSGPFDSYVRLTATSALCVAFSYFGSRRV